MSRAAGLRFALVVAVAGFGIGAAHARDDEYQRLADRFDRLASDPVLGTRAQMQFDRARASLAQLKEAGRGDRDALVYITDRRIEIARAAAEADYLDAQRTDLQRENDRMQLEIARRDAAQARAELERQRLQSQIRAEEAERLAQEAEAARVQGEQANQAADAARAEADQAKRMADAQAKATALAKKEAELSAAVSGTAAPAADKPGRKPAAPAALDLPGLFAPGKSSIGTSASRDIAKAAAFANADPARRVHIEVTAGADKALALQRAKAVRDALVSAGVGAARISTAAAVGKGNHVEIGLSAGK